MFAPAHHQATRYVIPVRRELAVRTIFNFLGPLTNPAGATRQLIGVSDPAYLETMAGALALLGTKHALLVSSEDGLDELSISAPTRVVEVVGGRAAALHGGARGRRARAGAGRGGPGRRPEQNAADRAHDLRRRARRRARDLAVLNAGAAIYAGGGADTLGRRRARGGAGDRRRRGGGRAGAVRARRTRRAGAREPPRADRRRPRARRSSVGAAAVPPVRVGGRDREPGRRERRAERSFQDALARPGLSVIAEHKRRSPSAGADPRGPRARGRGRRLRARRRGGALDPDRGAELRRLARRSARGARARPRCRSCARTSSSTPTRCTRRSRPAPTRSC